MPTGLSLEVQFAGRRYASPEEGLNAFARLLGESWKGTAKRVRGELQTFLQDVAAQIAKTHGRPWPGGTGANTLSRRSGVLVGEIVRSVKITGTAWGDLTGYISIPEPYGIHETGGIITGKGKLLTVPLPAALDASGVPLKKSSRDWGNTFVAETRAGNTVIFQRRGTQIVPLYVLETSVRIRPRLGVGKAIDNGIPRFVERALDAILAGFSFEGTT